MPARMVVAAEPCHSVPVAGTAAAEAAEACSRLAAAQARGLDEMASAAAMAAPSSSLVAASEGARDEEWEEAGLPD